MITPQQLLVYKIKAEMLMFKLHAQREQAVQAERGKVESKLVQPVIQNKNDGAEAQMGIGG